MKSQIRKTTLVLMSPSVLEYEGTLRVNNFDYDGRVLSGRVEMDGEGTFLIKPVKFINPVSSRSVTPADYQRTQPRRVKTPCPTCPGNSQVKKKTERPLTNESNTPKD